MAKRSPKNRATTLARILGTLGVPSFAILWLFAACSVPPRPPEGVSARVDTVLRYLIVPGVCFLDVPDLIVRGHEAYAATSTDHRVPCIPVYRNATALQPLPGAVQDWIHLHELAHISLRHGNPPDSAPADLWLQREAAADCRAAEFLVRLQRLEMLDEVLAWLSVEFPHAVPDEVPTGADRALNIRRCIVAARSDSSERP